MAGDPYHCQCQKTTRLLAERLKWDKSHFTTTFQSKFGPEKWVGPSTVDFVAELANKGKVNVAMSSSIRDKSWLALEKALREKKCRYIGVSNFPCALVEDMIRKCKSSMMIFICL